jgi:peptidoglycan/LPS O-acetylase OafA/YrhL
MERMERAQPAIRGEFRADIQGLRAIAVLLVLVYHLWPETLTGGFVGVDVFFVISGFLITGHLLQHPPRNARDLAEFWGRRIRRLLPAAFLVLLVTAVASRIVAPETQWAAIATQVIASALYIQNWVLASNSVDYLAAEEAPTPVQHYWSLAVEEQFYVVWPVLLLAIFWFAGRARVAPIVVARLAMLGIIAGSLFLSVTATATEPASAYFITPTRVWELAAGGLVATLPSLGSLQLRSRSVDGVAWLGLGMILLAGAAFTPETPFPGFVATLPIAGAALLLLAAATGRRSPTRYLRWRPIQHLGDTSYSIYLWHWPLIILWPHVTGLRLTLPESVAILGATIVLATITKVAVEDPYRFSPKFKPLVPTFRFAAAGMLVLSIVGGAQLLEAQVRFDAALAAAPDGGGDPDAEIDPGADPDGDPGAEPGGEPGAVPTGPDGIASTPGPEPTDAPGPTAGLTSCVGAAAIVRGFDACPQDPAGEMRPEPVVARADRPAAYRDGCWMYAPFGTRRTCDYGRGDIRIALVGNSHAGQWLPTLQVLAKKHGWTITTYLASQCNATDATLEMFAAVKNEGCRAHGAWVMEATQGSAYDLVITSQRQSLRTVGDSWAETGPTAAAGYTSYLTRWSEAGTNILVVQDTPFPHRTVVSVPDCLARHPGNQSACGGTPHDWRRQDPLYDVATTLALPNVSTLEVMRFVCRDDFCPAVIGSLVVYFDGSHMTSTYARSIAPFVEAEILVALDRAK